MEYVVLTKPQICIFKIPPLMSSKGYCLSDWTEMIWEGQVKVVSIDNKLEIRFQQDNKIFATCPVPTNYKEAVVKCNDSSRGFAIRLFNGGKFAWIGAAFRERSDAFDFNVCFTDYQGQVERESKDVFQNMEIKDFSLKQGQKIKANVPKNTEQQKQNFQDFDLGPVPGSQKNDDWSNFDNKGFDDFSNKKSDFNDFDFDNFGSQKKQENNQQQMDFNFGQQQKDFNFGQQQNTFSQNSFNNNNQQNQKNKVQEVNLLDL